MLDSWKAYLLQNIENLKDVTDFGNLYEKFIATFPEFRKQFGVYYTPEYIVNYIVKNTVGKLIENKKPEDISKIKILDPACGSGSFLLGAYQFLLNYHQNYYIQKYKGKINKDSPINQDGSLKTAEKKRILVNNIFGVDIDTQAVEVTKLSLLIKAMEGETTATIETSLKLFHQRVLPNLDSNILAGNSLISPDFYNNDLFLTPREERKINVFDWNKQFKNIIENGGFDCVIGNPPYVRIQNLEKHALDYFSKYTSAIGNYDIYCLFVEKGISLLKIGGELSYILPHRFFKSDYGEGLRKYFSVNNNLNTIFDFDGYYIFENASINTCIINVKNKMNQEKIDYFRIKNHKADIEDINLILNNLENEHDILEKGQVNKKLLTKDYWNFVFNEELSLFDKLNQNKRLSEFGTKILVGLQTSADTVFIVKLENETNKYYEVSSKYTQKTYQLEKEIMFPLLRGAEVKKYQYPINTDLLIFPYKLENDNPSLIGVKMFESKYPKIWAYLNECKEKLMARDKGKLTYEWYAFGRNQNLNSFCKNKIMTTVLSGHNSFTLDLEGKFYFVGGGNAGVYGIQLDDENLYPYLIGLLNSKLLNWYHSKISLRCYQTAFSYGKRFIEKLPIKTIDFNNELETQYHNQIVKLVETIIELNKRLITAKLETEKETLQRRINYTNDEIDKRVYKLYNISDKEKEIIENNAR